MQRLFADEVGSAGSLKRALSTIRKHLGMEMAYISEFVGEHSVFQVVDAPGFESVIKVGDSAKLDEIYCRHILAGRLPELVTDAADYPLAVSLPVTRTLPVGAHMSLPILAPGGDVVGMFCCLSRQPNHSLNARDLQVMQIVTDLASDHIAAERGRKHDAEVARARIEATLRGKAFRMVYQPIWDLGSLKPIGVEALCRFSDASRRPDQWFAEAHAVGLGEQLELAAVAMALPALEALPRTTYLSLNVAPATILGGKFMPLLAGVPADRILRTYRACRRS